MMVIAGACAVQTAGRFRGTIMQSMVYGLITVFLGLTISYYANLAPGGTIVLTGTLLVLLSCLAGSKRKAQQPVPGHCQCQICEEEGRQEEG